MEEDLKGQKILKNERIKLERIEKLRKEREKERKEQCKERRRKAQSIRKKVRRQEESILMQSMAIFRGKLAASKKEGERKGRAEDKAQERAEEGSKAGGQSGWVEQTNRQEVERRLAKMDEENRRVQANILRIRQRKQKSLDRLFQR